VEVVVAVVEAEEVAVAAHRAEDAGDEAVVDLGVVVAEVVEAAEADSVDEAEEEEAAMVVDAGVVAGVDEVVDVEVAAAA